MFAWSSSTLATQSLGDIQTQQIADNNLTEAQNIYDDMMDIEALDDEVVLADQVLINSKIKFIASNDDGTSYGFVQDIHDASVLTDDLGNVIPFPRYLKPRLISANPWIKGGRRCTLLYHRNDQDTWEIGDIYENKVTLKLSPQNHVFHPSVTSTSNPFSALTIE